MVFYTIVTNIYYIILSIDHIAFYSKIKKQRSIWAVSLCVSR